MVWSSFFKWIFNCSSTICWKDYFFFLYIVSIYIYFCFLCSVDLVCLLFIFTYIQQCLYFFNISIIFFFFTLQYCIGFAIHQHASATGVHVFPILNPPPTSLAIPSLWVIPVHQPQASCILHWTWTGDSFLIWYCTCFNAILPNHPPSPSPTESKRWFYTSVSLLLSHIQGCHYHLSKFHIYALVYYIGVFLSGLLHSV